MDPVAQRPGRAHPPTRKRTEVGLDPLEAGRTHHQRVGVGGCSRILADSALIGKKIQQTLKTTCHVRTTSGRCRTRSFQDMSGPER